MSNLKSKRRDEFISKMKSGKRGYHYQQLMVQAGDNKSWYSEYPSSRVKGKAILGCDDKLFTFDTENETRNVAINVYVNKAKRMLIDIIVDGELYKAFDIGFKHENSSEFIFAAYVNAGIEECLYVVNALGADSQVNCIKMFTPNDDSDALLETYELVACGVEKKYDGEKVDWSSLGEKGVREDELLC